MLESRKRPLPDDGEVAQAKKRVLTSTSGSPEVNGLSANYDAEEPADNHQLELFRKEAIFRRMKHYSRENERNQARIAQLEQRRSSCEAGLVAIAACWKQLVDTVQTLTPPEELPAVEVDAKDIFDLSQHISTDSNLKAALEKNMLATEELITSFMKLNPVTFNDQAYQRSQTSQTECIALRSEIALLQQRLDEVQSEKEQLHDDLIAAEIKLDRMQSGTVAAMQTKGGAKDEASQDQPCPAEGSTPNHGSSTSPPPQINGHNDSSLSDIEACRLELKISSERASKLEAEIRTQAETIAKLEVEDNTYIKTSKRAAPTVEMVSGTVHYKILSERRDQLEHTKAENDSRIGRLDVTIRDLQSSRTQFEEETRASAQQVNQELKVVLAKRDADLTRLRDQRELLHAELNELRSRENIKYQSSRELKALAESRAERITQLESEVRRHKAKLAAHAGNEDLMKHFWEGKVDDLQYVDGLRRKLLETESKLTALQQSMSTIREEQPDIARHIASEAATREELAAVTTELSRYRSLLGEPSSDLARQLQAKEDELQKMRLLAEQHQQAEDAIYAEVERLSGAWEALDGQLKNKVVSLTAAEEKIAKSAHEKAKADNKYFAAMRDRESVEIERKNAIRNLEKQAKVVERLADSEKNLQQQIGHLDAANQRLHRVMDEAETRFNVLETDALMYKKQAECTEEMMKNVRKVADEKYAHIHHLKGCLFKRDDDLARTKAEVNKLRVEMKKLKSASASEKEADLMEEAASVWRLEVIIEWVHRDSLNVRHAKKTCAESLSPSARTRFANNASRRGSRHVSGGVHIAIQALHKAR
ncbi:BRE1 E3 ubiquitin ligase-domain-containing protein [Suillus subalutaceus]|uniref:BRE1 E3 ubiquitin ligase-domain-containing protein n=1 Tax=Suillus subalutaceus TaxID=48586 RepID=UPI001B880568|nr:BRE1 E3 ubiquitin ligase-domain-containing protein [Suillus subalutaceus]KAG1865769.1 BRE1 E3 ubiquitin ligase-domain-containing protein [Suillus subalutaceus]